MCGDLARESGVGGRPLHTAEWAAPQLLQAQLAKDMEALPDKHKDQFRSVS